MTASQARRGRRSRPRPRPRLARPRPDHVTAAEGSLTEAADAGFCEVLAVTAPGDGSGEEPQAGRDVQVVLREQVAGLLDRWQRLSARYGELGTGHERGGSVATAALMSMGAVVYDTCAGDLADLLAGLDCQLSGEDGPCSPERAPRPGPEGPA